MVAQGRDQRAELEARTIPARKECWEKEHRDNGPKQQGPRWKEPERKRCHRRNPHEAPESQRLSHINGAR